MTIRQFLCVLLGVVMVMVIVQTYGCANYGITGRTEKVDAAVLVTIDGGDCIMSMCSVLDAGPPDALQAPIKPPDRSDHPGESDSDDSDSNSIDSSG